MKRSTHIPLIFLTAAAASVLESCGRQRAAADPCQAETFNEAACQEAVQNRGYYSHGAFVPHAYGNAYPYYYGAWRNYAGRGGVTHSEPSGTYAHPSSTTVRGGFGTHGGGGGGE